MQTIRGQSSSHAHVSTCSETARQSAVPRQRLTVIIPAYQEAGTLAQVLRAVLDEDTERYGFEKEIIVCDDASTDGTAAIVEELAHRDPRVRLIAHSSNRGKAAAIRSALCEATGDYCLIQDADLEYPTTAYPGMLERTRGGARVVYGSRFLRRAWPTGMRPANWLANRALTLTSRTLYGLSITDEATCLKLFETKLLRELEIESVGFEFCPEVTAKLGRRRIAIEEVAVEYTARGSRAGKKIRWYHGMQALWTLLKFRV